MTTRDRAFGHFCVLATALERVGDRWALLVVRDLLSGPRRFTDLLQRLAGITPKTLTQRLRDLQEDGLVEADRVAGRREVWYRLTPAGEDLAPALEELLLWGLRHAARAWQPGEPAHPEHLLLALRVRLERDAPDAGQLSWAIRFLDGGSYAVRHDAGGWTVSAGDVADPQVAVTTTRDAWARFLTSPPAERSTHDRDVKIVGSAPAVADFLSTIAVFPFDRDGVRL